MYNRDQPGTVLHFLVAFFLPVAAALWNVVGTSLKDHVPCSITSTSECGTAPGPAASR